MAEEKKILKAETKAEKKKRLAEAKAERKQLARLEVLIVALMDAQLDKKTVVFNFTKTELEYANREWIVYEEG